MLSIQETFKAVSRGWVERILKEANDEADEMGEVHTKDLGEAILLDVVAVCQTHGHVPIAFVFDPRRCADLLKLCIGHSTYMKREADGWIAESGIIGSFGGIPIVRWVLTGKAFLIGTKDSEIRKVSIRVET